MKSNTGDKNIQWNYDGKADFAVGTGATKLERLLGWGACLIIPAALLIANVREQILADNALLVLLTLFIAFDVGGGVVCNSLNSCKRFYHAPTKQEEGLKGKLLKNHIIFSLFHIHPIVVWGLFGKEDVVLGIVWYLLLNVAAMIIIKTPLYLKRPVSMQLIMTAIMINYYFIAPVTGFEWLIPLLFIKIIYGHLVMEEPYRPLNM